MFLDSPAGAQDLSVRLLNVQESLLKGKSRLIYITSADESVLPLEKQAIIVVSPHLHFSDVTVLTHLSNWLYGNDMKASFRNDG